MKKINFHLVSFLILLAIIVAPFLLVSIYNHPSADDFVRVEIGNYFTAIWKWYMVHNGRYFNAIITLTPFIYSKVGYIVFPTLVFGFLFWSIFQIMKKIFPFKASGPSLMVATILFSYILLRSASISEAFYWYASVSAYTVSFALYLFLLKYLIVLFFDGVQTRLNLAVVVALLFALIGNHEMIMVTTCLTIGFTSLFILFFDSNKRNKIVSVLYTLWAGACALIVLLSPGSDNRRSKFSGGSNLLTSLDQATDGPWLFFRDVFLRDYMFWLILALVVVIVLLCLSNNKEELKNSILGRAPLYWGGISVFLAAAIYFVPCYSMGTFGGFFAGRIPNITFLMYVLLIIANVLNVGFWWYYKSRFAFSIKVLSPLLYAVTIVFVLVLFTQLHNWKTVVTDLSSDEAYNYNKELVQRKDYVQSQPMHADVVVVPLKHKPLSLFFNDITTDPNYWTNASYVDYFDNAPSSVRLASAFELYKDFDVSQINTNWVKANHYEVEGTIYKNKVVLRVPEKVSLPPYTVYFHVSLGKGVYKSYSEMKTNKESFSIEWSGKPENSIVYNGYNYTVVDLTPSCSAVNVHSWTGNTGRVWELDIVD